jgi:predicted small metal-binding protein
MSDEQLLRVGCVCGWEVIGTADEIVPAVLDHGERIHNMAGTREQVLANAQPIGPAAGAATEPSPSERSSPVPPRSSSRS